MTIYRQPEDTCHYAAPGTYGHECGKPATWIAVKPSRAIPELNYYPAPSAEFRSGRCDECRSKRGPDNSGITRWERAV